MDTPAPSSKPKTPHRKSPQALTTKKDGTPDKRTLATSVLDDPIVRNTIVSAMAAGATAEIAASIAYAQGFKVTAENIWRKKADDPEFKRELETAALRSDSMVVLSLYRKATQGQDTAAMIFWLKNRQPHLWRDRKELEVNIPDITGTLRSAAEAARERKRALLAAVKRDAITVDSVTEGEIVPFVASGGNGNGNGNGHE